LDKIKKRATQKEYCRIHHHIIFTSMEEILNMQ
jgi:hypothetical protein